MKRRLVPLLCVVLPCGLAGAQRPSCEDVVKKLFPDPKTEMSAGFAEFVKLEWTVREGPFATRDRAIDEFLREVSPFAAGNEGTEAEAVAATQKLLKEFGYRSFQSRVEGHAAFFLQPGNARTGIEKHLFETRKEGPLVVFSPGLLRAHSSAALYDPKAQILFASVAGMVRNKKAPAEKHELLHARLSVEEKKRNFSLYHGYLGAKQGMQSFSDAGRAYSDSNLQYGEHLTLEELPAMARTTHDIALDLSDAREMGLDTKSMRSLLGRLYAVSVLGENQAVQVKQTTEVLSRRLKAGKVPLRPRSSRSDYFEFEFDRTVGRIPLKGFGANTGAKKQLVLDHLSRLQDNADALASQYRAVQRLFRPRVDRRVRGMTLKEIFETAAEIHLADLAQNQIPVLLAETEKLVGLVEPHLNP